jgi:hypothetical protein
MCDPIDKCRAPTIFDRVPLCPHVIDHMLGFWSQRVTDALQAANDRRGNRCGVLTERRVARARALSLFKSRPGLAALDVLVGPSLGWLEHLDSDRLYSSYICLYLFIRPSLSSFDRTIFGSARIEHGRRRHVSGRDVYPRGRGFSEEISGDAAQIRR